MSQMLYIHTKVLPGGRIEITSPELAPGEDVDVVVTRHIPDEQRRHAIDILEALPPRGTEDGIDIIEESPGGELFKTPEEADEYLKRERDSWDR